MCVCVCVCVYINKIFVGFVLLFAFCEHVLELAYGIYKYLLLARKIYYFFYNKRKTLHNNPIYVTRIELHAFGNYKFTNALF